MPLWKHPGTVGETYWQHMRYGLGLSYFLFRASLHALIHAFLPDLKTNERYDLKGVAEYTVYEVLRRPGGKE